MKTIWLMFLFLATGSVWGQTTKDGFRIASPGHDFTFPYDHGAHPEYKIEWWYITGHVWEKERRFGFQATFFRIGLQPDLQAGPAFGTNQVYMAHMALMDVDAKRFIHEERLNRGGWDASAKVGDLDVRNGNWSLVRNPDGSMRLVASIRGKTRFDFELQPAQPVVIFGEDGVSKKGADPSAASLYITYPRLAVRGVLRQGEVERKVVGQAWMDHEISSSQLAPEQTGWDWASVQLDDGRELMIYQLRQKDGTADPYSKLVWIEGGDEQTPAKLTHLSPDKWSWDGERIWTSKETGGAYPLDIKVTTEDPSGAAFEFQLMPLADEQEMIGRLGGVSYWEGACNVLDNKGKRIGVSYVELTGYVEGGLGALRAK